MPGASVAARVPAVSGRAQHGLDLEVDRDLVADDHAAAVERHRDVDAEVGAVDRGAGREARAGAAEGVRAEALGREGERHRPGHALDRELAVQQQVAVVDAHGVRGEGPGGVVGDVEEVGRADVVVALLVVGVDGRGVDRRRDTRTGDVLAGHDLTGERAEATAYLAHHHVPNGEGDVGVHGVDVPGTGGVARDQDSGGHEIAPS